jgi:Carbon-nitrogen hydrolase
MNPFPTVRVAAIQAASVPLDLERFDLLGKPDAAGALRDVSRDAANLGSGMPQIWVAPTADFSEPWVALLQAIAVESGAFVVGVCQFTEHLEGGTVIIDARGRNMQGPVRNAESILYADCDLRVGADEKQLFDVTGHYSCESILLPQLGFDFVPPSN